MNEIDKLFELLESKTDSLRYEAFKKLLAITDKKVKWIYDKWFALVKKLSSENSFQRSIGLLLLANLAKSDSENRFAKIIDDYLLHINDEKFITARQCIQNIWRIATGLKIHEQKIIDALIGSYYENLHLKTHGNLIKQDIILSLTEIYKHNKDKKLAAVIDSFIEEENDIKLKKILSKVFQPK